MSFFRTLYTCFSEQFMNLPRVNFSPESGGSVNPSKAMDDISTHGTIRLKKQYKVRLLMCMVKVMSTQGSGQQSQKTSCLSPGTPIIQLLVWMEINQSRACNHLEQSVLCLFKGSFCKIIREDLGVVMMLITYQVPFSIRDKTTSVTAFIILQGQVQLQNQPFQLSLTPSFTSWTHNSS